MDSAFFERLKEVKKQFGAEEHAAVEIFEDAPRYRLADVVELARLAEKTMREESAEGRSPIISEFSAKRKSMQPLSSAPERIWLWPEGKIPRLTEYTENKDFRYNHDPDYRPYMLEVLVPEYIQPKGAVVCIAGGDKGMCTLFEGYQTCLDFVKLGYQCFLLNNRPNHNPWNEKESGADTARAIRMIRRDVAKYRIKPDNIAVAGFSNGGLTGENCIRYYSGEQTVAQHFPGYQPDELDQYCGAPDAYICVYGPRLKDTEFDYTDVKYPPTFFAVGREDFAMQNLHPTYVSLVEHGVPVEVHTFSGTPHGVAGRRIIEGDTAYPHFELWLQLADRFMQDAYRNSQK